MTNDRKKLVAEIFDGFNLEDLIQTNVVIIHRNRCEQFAKNYFDALGKNRVSQELVDSMKLKMKNVCYYNYDTLHDFEKDLSEVINDKSRQFHS
jgi:hypothetical protein